MKSKPLTTISAPKDYPTATFPPRNPPRSSFILLSDDGYLRASHSATGPAITTVPHPEAATAFVDFHTAATRARTLTELGWPNLRVICHASPR